MHLFAILTLRTPHGKLLETPMQNYLKYALESHNLMILWWPENASTKSNFHRTANRPGLGIGEFQSSYRADWQNAGALQTF